MADARYGGYLSADFELLGGVVDGMDVEDLSQEELATFLDARMMARNAAVNSPSPQPTCTMRPPLTPVVSRIRLAEGRSATAPAAAMVASTHAKHAAGMIWCRLISVRLLQGR